jgi:hypothetical protein
MNIAGSTSNVERWSVRMGSKYLSGQCVKLGYLELLMQVREFEVASGPQKFIYRTGGLAQAYRETLKQVAHSPFRIPNL